MQRSVAQPVEISPYPARQRNWLLIALIAALVVLLLLGLTAIGAYFLLDSRQQTIAGWQDPLAAVDVSRVRPDIAILRLLGEAPEAIVQEALAAGEPDSAYSLLVYNSAMSDAARSGNLLLVVRAFQEGGATGLASIGYQQVHSLAALSPALADVVRAESTLDAARGYVTLEMIDAARPSMAQAEALARYSPLLAPVKRQEIAQGLVDLYRQAGFDSQADDLAQFVRDPQGLPDARLVRGPFLPTLRASIAYPQQLVDAETNRKNLARAFLETWDATGGSDMEAARSALASALLQEDGIRRAVVAAELEAASQLSVQAAWRQDLVDWLTLKYMIARLGFGFNLVPEWELEADNIRAELDQAYADLFAIYGDLANALPEVSDINFAQIELLRQQLLLGRLGLYPDYAEEELAAALDQQQATISDQLPLLVVREPWGDGRIFRLAESFE